MIVQRQRPTVLSHGTHRQANSRKTAAYLLLNRVVERQPQVATYDLDLGDFGQALALAAVEPSRAQPNTCLIVGRSIRAGKMHCASLIELDSIVVWFSCLALAQTFNLRASLVRTDRTMTAETLDLEQPLFIDGSMPFTSFLTKLTGRGDSRDFLVAYGPGAEQIREGWPEFDSGLHHEG